MRAIGIHEPATVRSQHLDGFLGSDRSLCDDLLAERFHHWLAFRSQHWLAIRRDFRDLLRLNKLRRGVGLEILNHALRDQQQSINDASRQQYPERCTRGVYPEISQSLLFFSRDPADKRHGQRYPNRSRREVVISQARHLRQIAHGLLTAIKLPVGIRSK